MNKLWAIWAWSRAWIGCYDTLIQNPKQLECYPFDDELNDLKISSWVQRGLAPYAHHNLPIFGEYELLWCHTTNHYLLNLPWKLLLTLHQPKCWAQKINVRDSLGEQFYTRRPRFETSHRQMFFLKNGPFPASFSLFFVLSTNS